MNQTLTRLSNQSGILSIHKPVGPTSRQVIDEVQQVLGKCKIGHAGTLDPLAEGVLPLMINESTKLVSYLQQEPKTYRFRAHFDYRSESLDLGEPVEEVPLTTQPTPGSVKSALEGFEGQIQQVPPKYSAIKKDGKPLYERVRESEEVSPDARTVHCHEITLIAYDFPGITLEVTCGKGFYIRALVRDIAGRLNLNGGVVTSLLRTHYGPFNETNSTYLHRDCHWDTYFHPPRKAVENYPFVTCSRSEVVKISHGDWISRSLTGEEYAMAVGPDHKLHAILQSTSERGKEQWRPKRVLNRNPPEDKPTGNL
ncbi:MAG: tRNA pseudouridine(55) synthase TruB [bacterium]